MTWADIPERCGPLPRRADNQDPLGGIWAVVDAEGRPIKLDLSPGQDHDCTKALQLDSLGNGSPPWLTGPTTPTERGRVGKPLSAARRRHYIYRVQKTLGVSERRALGQTRSTQPHFAKIADDETALTEAIIDLASQFGRYGYRRITSRLLTYSLPVSGAMNQKAASWAAMSL